MLLATIVGVSVDTYHYGRIVISPVQFFYYNIWLDYSDNFGTHPWHWYLTNGLPVMLGLSTLPLLPLLMQILKSPRLEWDASNSFVNKLAMTMAFFVAGLSLIGHKEIRFLLPILPILHIIIGKYLHHIDPSHRYSAYSRNFLILTPFIHFTAALYLGLFHQVLLKHWSSSVILFRRLGRKLR